MGENHDKSFINEKILGRDMTLQRAVKYALVSVLCGVLFGVAALGVVALSHKLEAKQQAEAGMKEEVVTEADASTLPPEQEPQQSSSVPPEESSQTVPETEETIQLQEATQAQPEETGDAAEAGNGAEEETEETSGPAEQETGLSEDAVRELITQQLEEQELTVEDLNLLHSRQQDVLQQISGYLVEVSITLQETTWFESVVETERQYAGLILGKDEKEIQILTVAAAAVGGENLYVTFEDGSRQKAVVRKKDIREGLVMLAVSTNGLGSKLTESLEAITLYSGDLALGQPVLTAGASLGAVGSCDFGLINYIGETESVVDGSRVPVYTRAASHPEAGTFLITLSGQLVGVATQAVETVDGSRFVRTESIAGLLEDMKKGNDTAYLGITGSDISFEMKSENIPEGMLITDIEEDSPAEAAGIKRGDIIRSVGSREIKGLADYCSFMRNLRPEETSTMIISRGDRGTFQDIEISITAAGR